MTPDFLGKAARAVAGSMTKDATRVATETVTKRVATFECMAPIPSATTSLRYPLAQRGEERSLRRQAIRQSDWRRRSAILGRSAHAARVANTVAGAR